MSKIISVAVRKGGSLKTTSTLNIGYCLAKMDYKVLLLDFDPQADLTTSLGCTPEMAETNNIYQTMRTNELSIVKINDNISYIPSFEDLDDAESVFANQLAKESMLKRILDTVKQDFDFILIDCPPSTGFLTRNALVASDFVLIPMQTQPYALKGFGKMLKKVDEIKRLVNPNLETLGVFGTMFEKTRIIDKQVMDSLRNQYPDLVFKNIIRKGVALVEAGASSQDIFSYDQNSKGAEDYYNLTLEILDRINKN